KAAFGLVKLHRRDAEIEHDAIGGALGDDRLQFAEALLDQFQSTLRLRNQVGATRDRGLIAVDADDARAGRLQDRARIAPGAEGAVDIEPAVTHREPFDDAVKTDP